jgi:hypothetical protein
MRLFWGLISVTPRPVRLIFPCAVPVFSFALRQVCADIDVEGSSLLLALVIYKYVMFKSAYVIAIKN